MARRRLSRRQQQRIDSVQEQRRELVDTPHRGNASELSGQGARTGQVVTRHGQNLAIADSSGLLYHCLSRRHIGQPVCGDRVAWQPTTKGHGVVTALLERSTLLSRPNYSGVDKPLAANISQLVVVMAPRPPPGQYLLDQYLVAAENMGVKALIAFNKTDLLDIGSAAALEESFNRYRAISYPIIEISAKFGLGLDSLASSLRGEASILVGQSGVGKSSLVKALLPDLDIQVGRLSEASGMGRHTTSATTLYRLPMGGALTDSPGVRSFRLSRIDRAGLEQGFREFRPFIGRCRFSDCSHNQEPDCALVSACQSGMIHPQRLDNFRHMAANIPALHG